MAIDDWLADDRLVLVVLAGFLLGAGTGVASLEAESEGLSPASLASTPPTGCAPSPPDGEVLEPRRSRAPTEHAHGHEDHGHGHGEERARRVATWTVEPGEIRSGLLALCTEVGNLEVTTSPGDAIRLSAVFEARGPQAHAIADELSVEAAFVDTDEGLVVSAGQVTPPPPVAQEERYKWRIDLTLAVPSDAIYELRTTSEIGFLQLSDLRLAGLHVDDGVGSLEGEALSLAGKARIALGEGNVRLDIAPTGPAALNVTTGTGDVELSLERNATVGYDVRAATAHGDARIEVGPTEQREERQHGPGEIERARTTGFEDRAVPVQVAVDVRAGDVNVLAR